MTGMRVTNYFGIQAWSCKSHGSGGHGPREEPAIVVLLNYMSDFFLDVYVYGHKLVLSLAMARGASFCSEQQLMQRLKVLSISDY